MRRGRPRPLALRASSEELGARLVLPEPGVLALPDRRADARRVPRVVRRHDLAPAMHGRPRHAGRRFRTLGTRSAPPAGPEQTARSAWKASTALPEI